MSNTQQWQKLWQLSDLSRHESLEITTSREHTIGISLIWSVVGIKTCTTHQKPTSLLESCCGKSPWLHQLRGRHHRFVLSFKIHIFKIKKKRKVVSTKWMPPPIKHTIYRRILKKRKYYVFLCFQEYKSVSKWSLITCSRSTLFNTIPQSKISQPAVSVRAEQWSQHRLVEVQV